MPNSFSIKEMFLLGWPILSVLLVCSVVSIAVILERWVLFRKRKVDVRSFASNVEKVLSSGKDAVNHCAVFGEPMATIVRYVLSHKASSAEDLSLTVDRAVRLQVSELERFVPLLGTIAGAAPFIGLLGTVLGIIRAFRSLAVTGTGGPQVVAGGIAEALVATALGLIVAIPALVTYNYFSTKIRRLTESMEICSDQIVEILSRK